MIYWPIIWQVLRRFWLPVTIAALVVAAWWFVLDMRATIAEQRASIEKLTQEAVERDQRLARMDEAMSALVRTSERRAAAIEQSRPIIRDIQNETETMAVGDSPALSSAFAFLRDRNADRAASGDHSGGDADLQGGSRTADGSGE